MARFRSNRNNRGVPVVVAAPEALAAPPTLAPFPPLDNFKVRADPATDPVIVTPEQTDTQWSFSRWFREAAAATAAGFSQLYAAAVLCLHAYRLSRSDVFGDLAEQALEGPTLTRLHVDDSAKRWIDVYKYPDGRQIWCIPGTIDTVKSWITYAIPGMAQYTVNAGTFGAYAGLKLAIDAYWNYVAGNAGTTDGIPEKGLTIVGHSLGGAVAQYLAFRLNQRAAEANPTAPVYPVNLVTSLGAPAFLNKGTVVGGLLKGYKHVRGYNPGDPIPNMLISGMISAVAVGRYVTAINQAQAPAHYATTDFPIQPTRNANDQAILVADLQRARGFSIPTSVYAIGVARESELAKNGFYDAGAHGVRNYADRLEIICRDQKATPYPLFSRLVTMSRSVDIV